MDKLSGDAAEAALAGAWEKILGQDPEGQEIIHVLATPNMEPAWIAEFPVYQAWLKNGQRETDDIWRSFADIAHEWPYIVNARKAALAGIPNTRILTVDTFRAGSERWILQFWMKYLCKVHLPAIAAMSGEALYKIECSNFKTARIKVRRHDVNLFGAAGIMLAGGDNGDVEWRAFLNEDDDPVQFREDCGYVRSVRDFAASHWSPNPLPLIP